MNAHGQQAVYGVFDHVSACPVTAAATGVCSTATRSDLIQQTLAVETAGSVSGFRITSGNNYADPTVRRGFYLNIPGNTYRVVTTPEVVSLGGRESASVVWNIEQIVGTGTSSGAQMTCTPDKVSSNGVRLMADAHNGAPHAYISWTSAATNAAGQKLDTVPYSGSSSRSTYLVGTDDSAYLTGGMSGSGALETPGEKPDPNKRRNCYKQGQIASGSSAGGVQIDNITCVNPTSGVRRLSWRELF